MLLSDALRNPKKVSGLIGQTIAERYRVTGVLGRGATGAVFAARHEEQGNDVALKILFPSLASGPLFSRFMREARYAASLQHPGIVRVVDLGRAEGACPFMAMELLQGMTLRKLVGAGTLKPVDAASIALDTLRALEYAHAANIVHRDLKPGNLFMVIPAAPSKIKIVDFGMAKFLMSDEPELTRVGQVLGTPGYMSPEQVRNSKGVDHRTDLYAVGALLFYMLVGRAPVEGRHAPEIFNKLFHGQIDQHPRAMRKDVPVWLDEVTARALSETPDARPQTAGEFAAMLEDGLRKRG